MNNNGDNDDDDDKFEQQFQKGVAKSFSDWNSRKKKSWKKICCVFFLLRYKLLFNSHMEIMSDSNNRIDTVALGKFNR